jgi:acetyltransferase (GNAT) family protein
MAVDKITVRTATKDDSAELLRLYRAFASYHAQHEAVGEPSDADLAHNIFNRAEVALVALKGNSIVGFALCSTDASGLVVQVLFVDATHRRCGVATRGKKASPAASYAQHGRNMWPNRALRRSALRQHQTGLSRITNSRRKVCAMPSMAMPPDIIATAVT